METAGRAVVFSGTAVAIGLALLLFMPLPFMRGFGVAGLLLPAVSVAAAVTFLPAALSLVGHGSYRAVRATTSSHDRPGGRRRRGLRQVGGRPRPNME